jgi:hypothetical protein
MKAVWHAETESMLHPCRRCGRCEPGAFAMKAGEVCGPCEAGDAVRANPLAVGISKLELKAGDVVVLKVNAPMPPTADEINRFIDVTQSVLPDGVKCLVLTPEFDLTVLRDGTAVEPVADTPTVVGG